MTMKRLPIGIDDFEKLRQGGYYYVDKTLMIKDFLEMKDEVALIARPRRFGKTLNMTMLRDFFDMTKNSLDLFHGLAIMETEYGKQINSRPVIYFTFKDCKGDTAEDVFLLVKQKIYQEFLRYEKILRGKLDRTSYEGMDFYDMIDALRNPKTPIPLWTNSIQLLTQIVKEIFGVPPILLIDEYDQPIMSSYEKNFHEQMGTFFSNLYGSAMKGNPALGQALLTGVQRVAKESIFSQFNNARVYTVLNPQYASYFGLTEPEVEALLRTYGLSLTEAVKKEYDGYSFGGVEVYNPWSLLNYADTKVLDYYWINTSSNAFIRKILQRADQRFWENFDHLVLGEEVVVGLTLETSYIERDSNYSLWGLLVNSGYLTVRQRVDVNTAVVKIPNEEVMSEFQVLISEIAGIEALDLRQMFQALLKKDMERFLKIYRGIVISCTRYMDAKENAYHMLFLGMCITLKGLYRVTSNLESGYGRSDIILESKKAGYPHVIIEFKQGKDLERLKKEALQQIIEQKYYADLHGEVLCVGLAHDKKKCEMEYRVIEN
ncbi:MAG TPA: ATP-binding protein [Candidatus Enterocloster faecavium]|uniref:ATP-binding protein n=1 Tax=Candidatus Enterocloster faecavium TaxID=2838560 RepID=A0A9D2RLE4_9FIRM|nr:ATP-binding protein [Candidatus Enterocloster faecavium]